MTDDVERYARIHYEAARERGNVLEPDALSPAWDDDDHLRMVPVRDVYTAGMAAVLPIIRAEAEAKAREARAIEPPPPLDFNGLGWARSGRWRIRRTWFFGLTIVEELWESETGERLWRKCNTSVFASRER